jgi:hypothetical protein
MWTDFLRSNYNKTNVHSSQLPLRVHFSNPWKHLLRIRSLAKQSVCFYLGTGKCSFWFDNWTGKCCLSNLNSSVIYPHSTVVDRMRNGFWDVRKFWLLCCWIML